MGSPELSLPVSGAARRCRQRPQHPRHRLPASSRDVSCQRAGRAQVAGRDRVRERRRRHSAAADGGDRAAMRKAIQAAAAAQAKASDAKADDAAVIDFGLSRCLGSARSHQVVLRCCPRSANAAAEGPGADRVSGRNVARSLGRSPPAPMSWSKTSRPASWTGWASAPTNRKLSIRICSMSRPPASGEPGRRCAPWLTEPCVTDREIEYFSPGICRGPVTFPGISRLRRSPGTRSSRHR